MKDDDRRLAAAARHAVARRPAGSRTGIDRHGGQSPRLEPPCHHRERNGVEVRRSGRHIEHEGRPGEAEDAVAVGGRGLGRAARRRAAVMAAQLERRKVGRGGRIGGEPRSRQGECDALDDEREYQGARGQSPPAARRTSRRPIHAGPRLRQNTGVTACSAIGICRSSPSPSSGRVGVGPFHGTAASESPTRRARARHPPRRRGGIRKCACHASPSTSGNRARFPPPRPRPCSTACRTRIPTPTTWRASRFRSSP